MKGIIISGIVFLVFGLIVGAGVYHFLVAKGSLSGVPKCKADDFGSPADFMSHVPCLLTEDFYREALGDTYDARKESTYPSRQFAQARDTQRNSNTRAILDAVGENMADNSGTFKCAAGQLPRTLTVIGSGAGEYNMHGCIVPTYISMMPTDPSSGVFTSVTSYRTEYRIMMDPTTRRVTVDAPYAEVASSISITR